MIIAVEAWQWADEDAEEPCPTECVDQIEFPIELIENAKEWAWQRMEEGYVVRMWRR